MKQFHQIGGTVEDAAAFWTEQPFMTVGGKKVDTHGLNIHWQGAHALDRIHTEVPPRPVDHVTDGPKVHTKAAAVLDMRDRDDTCTVGHGIGDILSGKVTVGIRLDFDQLDTKAFEVLPWIAVGRILHARGHHVVAFSPVKTARDHT